MASDKKPTPVPVPVPVPTPAPVPVLTPTTPPPLQPTPGVPVATGEVVLRCSGCHKLSRWPQAFVDQHKGGIVTCPVCGATASV